MCRCSGQMGEITKGDDWFIEDPFIPFEEEPSPVLILPDHALPVMDFIPGPQQEETSNKWIPLLIGLGLIGFVISKGRK
jgi:hypothetical protein